MDRHGNSAEVRFRRVLFSIVRLCQCSGQCPISVYGSNTEKKKIAFAVLSVLVFIGQTLMSIYFLLHFYNLLDWSEAILSYINLCVAFTIRLHAAVMLIESYAKRSIHSKVLENLDAIEAIFKEKLQIKTNDDRLRDCCHRIIFAWVVKFLLLVFLAFLAGILSFDWILLYRALMALAPFYTSTLFYAQFMIYLSMVEYNIATINECLMKLKDTSRIVWRRQQRQAMLSPDVCQQVIQLRICYDKVWYAVMLINHGVRWSLLLAINNDFVLYFTNLYWMLYLTFNASFGNLPLLGVMTMYFGINVSHFIMISRVCEQISEQVSP